MAKAGVQILVDLSEYTTIYADKLAQGASTKVRNFAKRFVAKDTRELMGSIQVVKISQGQYIIFSKLPYAAAQEYGLAPYGLPQYRFTPYMRPAAAKATEPAELTKIAAEASDAAARAAKR